MDNEFVTQTAIQAARSGQRVVLVTTPQTDRAVEYQLNRAADRVSMVDGTAHFNSGGWVRRCRHSLHAAGVTCDLKLVL